ncbi:DUF6168 family protein [uncultured Polaribacter sp.]|uniref:DUF6168 family protein n=1 Tax=uncultured Polaribacter sp. TaxID=174711 RepID=UPI0034552842
MIKSFITNTITLFFFLFVCFSLHNIILENQQINLPYSLKKVYIFHFGYTLLVSSNFLVFCKNEKFFEQIGFIYLGTLAFKFILFAIVFYKYIFTDNLLINTAKASFIVPMIIFLTIEVIIVAKILKKKQ